MTSDFKNLSTRADALIEGRAVLLQHVEKITALNKEGKKEQQFKA
jgi:hypothetical protein